MIKTIKKKWGKEEWIVNGEYCGKLLHIERNSSSSVHYHRVKKETFYILNGQIKLLWSPLEAYHQHSKLICCERLNRGAIFTLQPGTVHQFTGFSAKNIILELSTFHDEKDTVRFKEK